MEMEIENPSPGEESGSKTMVVILVGAPGSGKSTFCETVMEASTRPWVRVCQDTIGNGKAGTKAQCLAAAGNALKDGKSVFIDRCNLEKEQRAEFVKLRRADVEVHGVVLDLPAKVCIARSVKRSGHEGNLQGGRAAMVVNRMLQKKELPKLSEGFHRITFCQSENEVEAAVSTYSSLGLSDGLPAGCFGEKKMDSKVQVGIMKFLKKAGNPVDAVFDRGSSHHQPIASDDNASHSQPVISDICIPEDSDFKKEREADTSPAKVISNELNACKESAIECNISSADAIPTLAFPSISTADFQFNLEKASDIIVEKVGEFVNKVPNARFVLVDISKTSKILTMVKAKALQNNIDSKRFFIFVGNITRLYSDGGLRCNVIANAANWRLKPGGGGVNAAIFSEAGPTLETATKEKAGSLHPGKAVAVPLPASSPLFSREGVTHVIHVLGPNMNSQRPNYLNNDYKKGCEILRLAYSNLFEGFASIARSQDNSHSRRLNNIGGDAKEPVMESDSKMKREIAYGFERSKRSKGSLDESGSNNAKGENVAENTDSKKSWGSWAQALYNISLYPEKHKGDLLEILDDVVVLNDLYPKAQRHVLVVARYKGLDWLGDVCEEHLQLLRTMHTVGLNWAKKFMSEDASLVFRLGYHSAPSMRQLHLHVISQDFDSKHLKNKKHWNSFNTAFFRDSGDVIKEIGLTGKATVKDDEKLLSMELRCHRCRSAHPNIPRLKSHVSNCQAPFPGSLLENGRLLCASSH